MDDMIEAALRDPTSTAKGGATEAERAVHAAPPGLGELAILLDIDGTLIELAPTPRGIVVPEGLAATLNGLLTHTAGALALVSGRSLADIDWSLRRKNFRRSAATARKCALLRATRPSTSMRRQWRRT